MAKKKSYNPFKMWGSYAGIYLNILYHYFSLKYYLPDLYDVFILFRKYIWAGLPKTPAYIHIAITGFLIGWGVHSLFRRFWK